MTGPQLLRRFIAALPAGVAERYDLSPRSTIGVFLRAAAEALSSPTTRRNAASLGTRRRPSRAAGPAARRLAQGPAGGPQEIQGRPAPAPPPPGSPGTPGSAASPAPAGAPASLAPSENSEVPENADSP